MDSHDARRGRTSVSGDDGLSEILSKAPSGALVIGVETDALFLPQQQERLAASLPGAFLAGLKSSDGHDGFLLEFEQLDSLIQGKLRSQLFSLYNVDYYAEEPLEDGATDPPEESLTREVEPW